MKIKAGSTIGILGGGQLGRMLTAAAQRLGFHVHIYCTNRAAPACDVTHLVTIADYDDEAALKAFAESVDLITYEFENIPVDAVDVVSAFAPCFPDKEALRASQDRLLEKEFIEGLGLAVAPYKKFETAVELEAALKELGHPAIAKRRLMGYDGYGQMRIRAQRDLPAVAEQFDGIPSILEAVVPFDREISVIVARSHTGDVAAYPVGENIHKNQVLAKTVVPAHLSAGQEAKAKIMATKIANALDYVGVLAVEMFVIDSSNEIIVNEIAPRVHNSGHWTMGGAVTSQFEQHIRAICGLPMGRTDAYGRVEMTNLFGTRVADLETLLSDPDAQLVHYGKDDLKSRRKTGHVTRVFRD